ncbi:exo-beta-N-acetylmuramidase NamZ domain-containing protein [Verrucomicrobiota bacterium sgz303538]
MLRSPVIATLWLGAALTVLPVIASSQEAAKEISSAFRPEKLAEIDAAISLAIGESRLPGGVLWLEHHGVAYHKAYGLRALEPQREQNTEDTIFDAASLTKVVATAPAVMKLIEQEKVQLDAPVKTYIPEFVGSGKDSITVRHLLTHTSGLRPGLALAEGGNGWARAIALACSEKPLNPPGTIFRYSDINFIVLGEVVSRVSGQKLQDFCANEIFKPLGMRDTGFLPADSLRERIAPTERVNGEYLRGTVHDPTSRRMGGVAGHAGLFTTAADLARFSRMFLQGGELDGVRVLKPETVRLMTTVQSPEPVNARRGLGWDIDSPYAGPRGSWFPIGSYGHTGWTGGSLWIDPFSDTILILLSNRNHPTEAGNVLPLRRLIGTLAAEAVQDFNFAWVPGALLPGPATPPSSSARRQRESTEVLNGVDVLVRDGFKELKGMRVGLVTNQTGVDRERRATIDRLSKAPGVQLVALFSPEHGIRGLLDEKVSDSRDEKTGLPVYSLYGANRAPSAEQLAGCDALVFDIQDIGCRFYTYISTLGECLTAAAKAGKKVIVLDRPNPIGGLFVEGPVLNAERSFTAWHELPVRHGMTVGELARMFNEERKLGADLTVIPCEGWSRAQWFDATQLPWVNPSPNMRSLNAATLYPGVGLLEYCNVSVGRGTDRPFEVFGAPYIDDRRLASEMNNAQLSGVRFVPVRFTPNASVFAGKECGGIQMIVTDRDNLNAVELGVTLASTLQRLYPAELKLDQMIKLLGDPATLDVIRAGQPLSQIRTLWAAERERFRERREKFLIYR